MISPDEQGHRLFQKYTSITPTINFKLYNILAGKDEKCRIARH